MVLPQMYEMLTKRKLMGASPNAQVLLRIYLTLMITNCTREYFFKSKLTKDEHQSTMSQKENLYDLSLRCILLYYVLICYYML